jgi:hypothetical protein
VDDLSPLTRLKNLEELRCEMIPCLNSLLPLAMSQKLKSLTVSKGDTTDLDELRKKKPDLTIHTYNYF